jgi:PAS domain S-box-containing protein
MTVNPRILIVEDEGLIALDLSRRLPKLGYEVCGMAVTGAEAVAQAIALRPDLVLMDICLRGPMDGIAAADQIRAQIDVPIVYLTANSDELTLRRAKLSRPASYLLKPFKERELQIGLEMVLANHRLQAEVRAARDHLEQRVTERTAELARVNAELLAEIAVRRQTEAQAREQADLLAKARDAIYVRDLDGRISYWNRSAERLYGVPAATAIGQFAPVLVGDGTDPTAVQAEQETLADGEWTGELRHRTRAGRELIVESRWTLVRDPAGTPQTILIVNTDVTERKQIADQLLRTQRLESVGALASGIAHDLNNVLAPILMAADLIKGQDANDAHLLEIVRSSARRGADMVRQVLMFVRGGTSEREPMDLAALVREVHRLMRETLPPSIRVMTQIAEDLGPVLGDATQLHQVLVNLCVNARDAMPDGGDLRLQVDQVHVDEAQVREKGDLKPGPFLRLTVADTGTGMPPEIREKIFDAFFTTKGVGRGTGLGLSTVASIVNGHRGFLEVESQVGRGTRFMAYLPECAAPESKSETVLTALPAGNGELIVVADDEHSVREVTRLTLEANNYRVVVAGDGAEALAVFLQHREQAAAVITDAMMPIMNGRALIHALRKFTPTLPILVFSAGDRLNAQVGALEADGFPVLRKPATPAQLLQALAAALHPADSRVERVVAGEHLSALVSV